MITSLTYTRRWIAKLLKQMEKDNDAPRSVITRSTALKHEDQKLEQELANVPEQTVLRIPTKIVALGKTLIEAVICEEASGSMDPLIERVRTHPNELKAVVVVRSMTET